MLRFSSEQIDQALHIYFNVTKCIIFPDYNQIKNSVNEYKPSVDILFQTSEDS